METRKTRRKRIEVALEFLSISYQSKILFGEICGPLTQPDEWKEMSINDDEDDDQKAKRRVAHVILRRIKARWDFWDEVLKTVPRLCAMFSMGENIILLMFHARDEMIGSANMVLRAPSNRLNEVYSKFEKDVGLADDVDGDTASAKLKDFYSLTESLCRPIIDRDFGFSIARSYTQPGKLITSEFGLPMRSARFNRRVRMAFSILFDR